MHTWVLKKSALFVAGILVVVGTAGLVFTHAQNSDPTQPQVIAKRLLGPDRLPVDIEVSTLSTDNTVAVHIDKPETSFKPGRYFLEMQVKHGQNTFTVKEEFVWGVLAMNFNRSRLLPNEEVYIQMAALTETGDTICDAGLELTITTPTGARTILKTSDESIFTSGECGDNNVTDIPDYGARYVTHGPGTYTVELENTDTGHTTTDSFEVLSDIAFDIERVSATRINPFESAYAMRAYVTPKEAVDGIIAETIPADFTVLGGNFDAVEEEAGSNRKVIIWEKELTPGKRTELRYTYLAPPESPELHFVGPLRIDESRSLVEKIFARQANVLYEEERQWQLAADATGNMILFWTGAADAPSGWTCLSCGSGDFYQQFARGSSTYSGAAGGASTHSHSGSGSVAVTGSGGVIEDQNTGTFSENAHTHSYTPSITATSSLPQYRTLKVIRANTAGEVDIPVNAVAIFDGSVPSGYTQYSDQNGNFIYGENSTTTTGGGNTHKHDIAGNTSAASSNTTHGSRGGGSQTEAAVIGHAHPVSSQTDSKDLQPEYVDIVLGKKTGSAAAPPNGLIAMWNDTPPTGWNTLSGPGQAFEGRFLKASSTYAAGPFGGGTSHNHADVTGITSDATGATPDTGRTGPLGADDLHTHSVDVTSISTDIHTPPYTDVILAKHNAVNPDITALSFNGGNDLTLNENSFVSATATMLVNDAQGCDTISSVTATLYLASTSNSGTTCTQDDERCYEEFVSCKATTTGNTCGASDTDAEYDCGFKVWYVAIPTDSGDWANDIWSVAATSSDGTNTDTATNSTEAVEINTLLSHNISGTLNYGSVSAGTDTGTTDDTVTITNTGNAALDTQIGGDNMCLGSYTPACSGTTIAESQQKFSTSSGQDYSAKTFTLAASSSPETIATELPKPTATTSAVTDDLYWGIAIQGGQTGGTYNGENTFTAVADGSGLDAFEYLFSDGTDVYYHKINGPGAVKIDDASDFGTMLGGGRQLIRTSDGTLYAVLADDAFVEVWKSDDGISWTEQDFGDKPSPSTKPRIEVSADSADIIHILYHDIDPGFSCAIVYITFDATADQYGSAEILDSFNGTCVSQIGGIDVDSNNIPHAVWNPAILGVDELIYGNKVGGSWSSTTADTLGLDYMAMTINEDDIAEISYVDVSNADLIAAVGNQNDATSFSTTTVNTTQTITSGIQMTSIGVDSAGNTWIAFILGGPIDVLRVAEHADADSWSTWTIHSVVDEANEPSLAIDSSDNIYVFYEDENDDIAYNIWNGSSFDGEVVLQSGTYQDVKAKWQFWNNN